MLVTTVLYKLHHKFRIRKLSCRIIRIAKKCYIAVFVKHPQYIFTQSKAILRLKCVVLYLTTNQIKHTVVFLVCRLYDNGTLWLYRKYKAIQKVVRSVTA